MDYQELQGKSLALILAGEGEDWSVLGGTLRLEEEALLLDRGVDEEPFLIQTEWLDRIKPTPAELREMLMNADYFLPLSLGTLPDDADMSEYESTGLKLPES